MAKSNSSPSPSNTTSSSIHSSDQTSIKTSTSKNEKKSSFEDLKTSSKASTPTSTTNPIKSSQSSESDSYESESDGPVSTPVNPALLPDITKNPLDEIAVTAANLGLLFGFSLATIIFSPYKPPAIYLMTLSTFHFLEFYITAKYNPTRVHKQSFIINNGSTYTLAHTVAIIESALGYLFWPNFKNSFLTIKIFGFLLIIFGQVLRSWAMITAGKSFNHLIQINKNKDHELVTTGIYSIFRHPSYAGFFWWAIGTQLLLVNPISFIGFVVILWVFFKNRIGFEEKFLLKFFGTEYEDYRKVTPTRIPFIQ